MTIYEENGYADRDDYLRSLADEYDIHWYTVCKIASNLGMEEDFTGLVTKLKDIRFGLLVSSAL